MMTEDSGQLKNHHLLPGIRNGVRAVIVRDRQVLLLQKIYEDGRQRYVLPGGAQDTGETLADALQRECREEIGTEVEVSGLLCMADFFKPRDNPPGSYRHHLEMLFLCQVPEDYRARNGHHPDSHQHAVVWVAQQRLASIGLFPSQLIELLATDSLVSHPVYLGEIRP